MKFYEPFRKVEECENLLGHSVFVKTQKAILLKVKNERNAVGIYFPNGTR